MVRFRLSSFNLQSHWLRLAFGIGVAIAYIAAFFLMYPSRGGQSAALSVLPVIIIAWFFGLRYGLVASLLAFLINAYLIQIAGGTDWAINLVRSGPGTVAVVVVGGTVGLLHDLREQVRRELIERQRVEETLRRSEARSRAILDAIPDLMFRLNRAGEILDFKGVESELYIPADKVIGTKIGDVVQG